MTPKAQMPNTAAPDSSSAVVTRDGPRLTSRTPTTTTAASTHTPIATCQNGSSRFSSAS